MIHILVVDDDEKLNRTICKWLNDVGFEAKGALNAKDAFEEMYNSLYDLIISDIMMPEIDGVAFAEKVREVNKHIPILFVSAKDDLPSKQKGFQIGIDDYMTKPVNYEELQWRIRALLRRAKISNEKQIIIGDVVISEDFNMVVRGEEKITLPKKEFELLFKLLSYPNKIFTVSQILDDIWGYDSASDAHTVDVHIGRLRERFRDNPDFKIVTIRGVGYKVVKA